MTVEEAYRLHNEAWEQAIARYGNRFKVPTEVVTQIGELTRARLCLASEPEANKCPDRSPIGKLKYYGFTEAFIATLGFDLDNYAPPVKRDDLYKLADAWWHENVGAQITTKDLMEATGWSNSTAVNYIKDNVTVFFPVKRGLYEVRDPKVERERDKQRQVDG